MKKIILSMVLIVTMCLILVACAEEPVTKEDWIAGLKEKGLVVTEHSTKGLDLEYADARLDMEINLFNGNFTVETVSYTVLTKDGDLENACKIIEFATEEDAIKYMGFYMNSRGENSGWYVAKDGNIVVVTNLSVVPEVINLIFK